MGRYNRKRCPAEDLIMYPLAWVGTFLLIVYFPDIVLFAIIMFFKISYWFMQ
jgi:hypothetical protein